MDMKIALALSSLSTRGWTGRLGRGWTRISFWRSIAYGCQQMKGREFEGKCAGCPKNESVAYPFLPSGKKFTSNGAQR
jgi:hypothetical protein